VPNTRGIRAGRAYVELGVNDRLTAALKRAQKRLRAFGAGVRAIGARLVAVGGAAVAGLGAMPQGFARTGDQLDKMAKRTGISVESLSELRFAAEQSGASLDELAAAVQRMNRRLGRITAGQGTTTQVRALEALGLSAESLRTLSPEERLMAIAEAMAAMEDPAEAAGLAQRAFGTQVDAILPLLLQGADGIEALRDQARALGLTISTETAADAAALTDALNAAGAVMKNIAFRIGAALAPAIESAAKFIARIASTAGDWIDRNRRLVATIAKVAAVVTLAGGALIAVGLLAAIAATALGGLVTVAGVVGSAIGVIGSALGALLSPIGLVVAAVAGLGGAILYYTGAGGEAIAWLSERFGELRAFVVKVAGGIKDALAGGDIQLAAQLLWLGLRVGWKRGASALNEVWLGARNFFITTAQKMWYGALAVAQTVFHSLEVAWIETTSFLSKSWTRFTSGFEKVWQSASSFVAKRMLEIQGLFDSGLDVEAAKRAVDEQLDAKLSEIDANTQRDLAGRESRRQRERDDAADLNEATLAEIGRRFEEAQDALRSGTDADIAETQRKLDEARAKLDEAIAEAQRRREEQDESGEDTTGNVPRDLIGRLQEGLAGLGAAIERGVAVRGTFNALAVQSLAAGDDTAERTAKATEQTAKNTRRLADSAQSGGLSFT